MNTAPSDAPTVLVAHSEALLRRLFSRAISSVGIQAVTADSAAQALGMLRTQPVAAIVVDYELPGLVGEETITQLRRSRTPEIPVLLVGAGHVITGEQALQLGADDYLPTPVDVKGLTAHVQALLQR